MALPLWKHHFPGTPAPKPVGVSLLDPVAGGRKALPFFLPFFSSSSVRTHDCSVKGRVKVQQASWDLGSI